ncbi:MAG: family 10 glycosylhydrolase [Candidatus Aegiribacteria sp.]|nr:family 10 glycosylhydrolase [Candidatus Aegiribacteria sp.]MBD3293862.1 family 10 glycosylhydrolase [Candidatus Fermentibacteria bacterium]
MSCPALILATLLSFSGVWSSRNIQPERWESIAAVLHENGFDTVFYPAAYGTEIDREGLEACLEYCIPLGIEVHALVVMFKSDIASDPVYGLENIETRIQVHSDGTSDPEWLDPSDSRNVRLMAGVCFDIASEFPVNGIQLDYIRWNYYLSGYSDSTRARYLRDRGIQHIQWPEDCLRGGQYYRDFLNWRASAVTDAVESVRDSLNRLNRVIEVSAAVMPHKREMVHWGQLWDQWLAEDLIDFVVPMNYTDSDSQLIVWGEEQLDLAVGERIYCGIAFRSSECELTESEMYNQISLSEEMGYDGFVVYRLCNDFLEILRPDNHTNPTLDRIDCI